MTTDDDRDWPIKSKITWWVKYPMQIIIWAVMLAGAAITGGKWLYSRASIEDIKEVEQKKVDKDTHEKDLKSLDERVKTQEKVLGVIHVNVVRIMERQDIQPKKLPSDIMFEETP